HISFQENDTPLLVHKLQDHVTLPKRKTSLAAGYDLTPSKEFTLAPGEQQLINTHLAIAIPPGYYGQLQARSSMAKKGIVVEGGVIDADYRGPIKIMLHNQGQQPFQFHQGDNPVAQIILIKIITPAVTEVSSLPPTNRTGGFGSTNWPLISCISSQELEHTLQPEDEIYLVFRMNTFFTR